VALWNLSRFGSALVPLVGEPEPLQRALEACANDLDSAQHRMWLDKLGLDAAQSDDDLRADLPGVLRLAETDFTLFFRRLADLDERVGQDLTDDAVLAEPLSEAYYDPGQATAVRPQLAAWLRRYLACVRRQGVPAAERRARMNRVNPKYVLRNYVAQLAIDKAEEGDPSLVRTLLELLRDPSGEQPQHEAYAAKRPDWARERAGCSMLSCSS
jgi:uncharacterized protein YdiU (UPF0061 family)